MCGVDVLDQGCIGIHVQVYVGCRVFEVVKSYLCVSVLVLNEFTPAVLHTVSLRIVASLLPWNSKAVGSAPDQTATFSEKSLVRLLAVVVGGWCWGCGGLVGFMFACFMWILMSV